jgi:Zn-finger nucleic acid-binding protein
MKTVTVGSSTFRECPHCAGLWLDPETLRRICIEQEKQVAVLGVSPLAGEAPNHSIPIRYIPCPVCQKLMNRVNFAHASNVIVDVCKLHGTWFDKDELRRTIEFIRAGGLEKARARQLAKIEEERRKLASERTAVATMILSDDSFPTRRSESMLDILRILSDK